MRRTVTGVVVGVVLTGGLVACGDDGDDNPTIAAPSATTTSAVKLGATLPTQWAEVIDNPWFPMIPGTVWHLTGSEDG